MVGISAVIPTAGKDPELLRLAILSLGRQTMPKTDYEILVVANGPGGQSIDRIRDLVTGLRQAIPNLRVIHEADVGSSQARNRGLSEAEGEIVANIDDDAVASTNWLEVLQDSHRDVPDAAVIGGRVTLLWPTRPPRWLSPSLEVFYSKLDLGDKRRSMRTGAPYPFGVNMSIRKTAALAVGGFSTKLGRRGNGLIGDEEDELCRRLESKGGEIMYEPRAVVHHHVRSERISPFWMLRRAFAQGQSQVISAAIGRSRGKGRRYWMSRAFRRLLSALVKGKGSLCTALLQGARGQALMTEAVRVSIALGDCRESTSLAIDRSRYG
jgi:cellulose synthase/poly-beta-1,6-N-acetylglucosamine synthase-like glycosyltransferase